MNKRNDNLKFLILGKTTIWVMQRFRLIPAGYLIMISVSEKVKKFYFLIYTSIVPGVALRGASNESD